MATTLTTVPTVEPKHYQLDQYGFIGRTRSIWVYWILGVVTLGIYNLIWYFKRNDELMHIGVGKADPPLANSKPAHSVSAMLFGPLAFAIPCFVSLYAFTRRIVRAEQVVGIASREQMEPALFWLNFVPLGGLYYLYVANKHLNEAIRRGGTPIDQIGQGVTDRLETMVQPVTDAIQKEMVVR